VPLHLLPLDINTKRLVGRDGASSPFVPIPSSGLDIIRVNEIHTLGGQLSPNAIAGAEGPAGLVPIPQLDPLGVCDGHLGAQQFELGAVHAGAEYGAEHSCVVGGGDGRDERSDVGECRIEGWDWCVPEVITVGHGLYEI
jgi:hypothetical protein